VKLDSQELPHVVVGACMEVHKHLGPGLVREAYKQCLAQELRMKELVFEQDQTVQVSYKGHWVDCGFTMDFVVEDMIIIEVQSVDSLLPIHKERLKSYLKLTGYETGFLVNFNVEQLRTGIKRLIVSSSEPKLRYK
jgi:GxxExxY protein